MIPKFISVFEIFNSYMTILILPTPTVAESDSLSLDYFALNQNLMQTQNFVPKNGSQSASLFADLYAVFDY